MAKKQVKKAVKKTAKKVVKKVLDSTTIDEKIVAEYKENKTLIDIILCYVKCYGGYVLAVLAGLAIKPHLLLGIGLGIVAGAWGWWSTCGCKLCKGGNETCCN